MLTAGGGEASRQTRPRPPAARPKRPGSGPGSRRDRADARRCSAGPRPTGALHGSRLRPTPRRSSRGLGSIWAMVDRAAGPTQRPTLRGRAEECALVDGPVQDRIVAETRGALKHARAVVGRVTARASLGDELLASVD